MKAEVIECDRCQAQVRADSREAVSFTKISVLKGGVCKEYDLCPDDAANFKNWLGPDATPVSPSEQPTEIQQPNEARAWAFADGS